MSGKSASEVPVLDADVRAYVHVQSEQGNFWFPVLSLWFSMGQLHITMKLEGLLPRHEVSKQDVFMLCGTDMSTICELMPVNWPAIAARAEVMVTLPALEMAALKATQQVQIGNARQWMPDHGIQPSRFVRSVDLPE